MEAGGLNRTVWGKDASATRSRESLRREAADGLGAYSRQARSFRLIQSVSSTNPAETSKVLANLELDFSPEPRL